VSKENKKKLVILGAGGFAREVFSLIDGFEVYMFSEDPRSPSQVKGIPVIFDLRGLFGASFMVAVGDPEARERLCALAQEHGLVSPGYAQADTVTGGDDVWVGDGTIMCSGVRLTTDIKIGRFVILNLNVTVGHDTVIEDFVTVSPGANISGNCCIGRGAYIGTGASIREGITVGVGAVVGMGAAVIRNVPPGETWGGVPAVRLK
jgi:sugar O-acyltransferase (sialic acid O-acetyltransferase NeuD family)